MIDYFVLLEEPRRPWLDPEALKEKFLRLSVRVHPDHLQGASEAEKKASVRRFADLNAAYNCLRDPKDRVAHLLELESRTKLSSIQRVPPETVNLFNEVGKVCHEVDAFLRKKAMTTSPLLKAQMFRKGLEWVVALDAIQQRINSQQSQLLDQLRSLSEPWDQCLGSSHRPAALPLDRLEEIYAALSFLRRWLGQLQERSLQLTL